MYWYLEHSGSCPHEPQLKALEPQPNLSTAAVWQCQSNHSFVQYLFSPLRGASESEQEEDVNGDSDAAKADLLISSSRRKKSRDENKQFKGQLKGQLTLSWLSVLELCECNKHQGLFL